MRKTYTISIFLISIILLSLIGTKISDNLFATDKNKNKAKNEEKLNEIIKYISSFYVENVDWDDTMQGAIEGMLSKLDPHSVYIPVLEAKLNEENFEGKYQGIGIQFDVIDGYLTVIAPIPGSPSDELGLMSGDKIIKINGESAINITNNEVQSKLKGEKGTTVDITIIREGIDKELEFTITRDDIPIFTVNTYFINEDKSGYIFLSRFAKTTEQEIENAISELEQQGMQRLILDLRWNAGGYLDQAVRVAAKFVGGHKKIVYTKGRLSHFDEEYFADTFGNEKVRDIPLIVLINHASASASEIVAGAIQDYDRGLIVGTTSFGKGLVQREFPLQDESRLRLTISKYYTPSGRLIQRNYKGKRIEDYYADGLDSADVIISEDSLNNRPVYFTAAGRKVFGGGGITPDIQVEYEGNSKSLDLARQFFQKRIFFETASRFSKENKYWKKDFDKFLNEFTVDEILLNMFKEIAHTKGLEIEEKMFDNDITYIKLRLKAEIARSLWDNNKYYQTLLIEDNQYKKALTLFSVAEKILTNENSQVVNN